MKQKSSTPNADSTLRRRAEIQLRAKSKIKHSAKGAIRSATDNRRLVHELQVHQIELELQNEELKKARDEMEVGMEKYSELYEFAPVGYFTLTSNGTIRQVNLNGAKMLGIERSRLVGQSFGRLLAAEAGAALTLFLKRVFAGQAKQIGEFALLDQTQPTGFVKIEAQRSPNAQECRAVVLDITSRRRVVSQLELLWEAAGVLLSTDDPDTMLQGLFTQIGPTLGVDTFFSYMVDETDGGFLQLTSYAGISAEKARAITRLKSGHAICGTAVSRRQPIHATQIQASTDETVRLAKSLGLQSYASYPLMSGQLRLGRLTFASRTRQQFEPDELAVLKTISHYVAIAYERLRIARALQVSEERYRNLFNSIDEGFCVIEMIFDKKGKPVDYRFIEINPSFETQTGIRDAVGKRMREITPTIESHWLEAYGKVAVTGKPVRFSNEAKGLNRWFDVYAFRLGGEGSQKIAILFSNITLQKQVGAALHTAQLKLAHYAVQLEVLVTKRTAELTTTNSRLKHAVLTIGKSKSQYQQLFLESQFMHKKLRLLTQQLISAQEEERKRISRELHDQVVQTLVGISVELSAARKTVSLENTLLIEKIAYTQRLVEDSVVTVHRFSRELRPALLDDLGLIPALHAYNKNLTERNNLKINMTAFGGVETMDEEKRTVLFRVAQEALTNVVRHAHATEVKISIIQIPDAVRMEISDNGKSFLVGKTLQPKANKRLGLVGMRERIEMVGGSLVIESTTGRGTTVRAEIPFTLETSKK